MDKLLEKIADSELAVLKILWQAGKEMTITEIRKTLSASTDWEDSTIKTLLYRLCKKGVVCSEKRGVFYYSPVITEQQYNDYATQAMINKLYGGSAKNLIASLIGGNKLNDSDIAELREMFKVGDSQ